MKKIHKGTRRLEACIKFVIVVFFMWPLQLFVRLFPRNKRVWVFGTFSGRRYADSSRVLYEWICKHIGYTNVVWISKNKELVSALSKQGIPALYAYSIAGIWASLKAGVYVYCHTSSDINYWLSNGSCKVNLWHGTPLKKILRDNDNKKDIDWIAFHSRGIKKLFYKAIYPGLWEHPDLLISTSPTVSKRLQSAFDLPSRKIKITGYPVNDLLFRKAIFDKCVPEQLIVSKAIEDNRKVILYLPTYRERANVDMRFDYHRLNNLLRKYNALFVIKLHPFDNTRIKLDHVDNIVQLSSEIDIYSLMSSSSALVTDYSSVSVDYMLLDRPVIYFVYDLDEYLKKDRNMYDSFDDIAGGPICRNFDEFIDALKVSVLDGLDEYVESRGEVRNIFHTYQDGFSASRVYKQILELNCLSPKQ